MTNDVEHLFIQLFPTWYIFDEMSVHSFACFKIELFDCYLLNFKRSLHILDINTSSDMCLANIFCQSVILYLFHCLQLSFSKQFLILTKSNLSFFFFLLWSVLLVVILKTHHQTLTYWYVVFCLILEPLQFCNLYLDWRYSLSFCSVPLLYLCQAYGMKGQETSVWHLPAFLLIFV